MKAQINGQTFEYTDKTLTVSKSVGIYECEFEFDSSWDGYDKTAVFQNGTTTIEVVITDGVAQIPWEVLTNIGYLCVGVYGTKDEKVMPTIWGNKLKIQSGTPTGSIGTEPTPSIYAQILAVATEAKDIAEDVAEDWANVYATAETLEPNESASVVFEDNTFKFGIPKGVKGDTGETGFSPTITVIDISGGHRVTITDEQGMESFDVLDGHDGQNGADGYSPTIAVSNITGGHRLTITDKNGTRTVDVMDGEQGIQGETGNGISSITKTATVGKVDTYTITYTDGTTTTFDVTNGEVTEASLEEALYDKADVITNTASGTIATFDDGANMPVKSLEVEINAVQDLHGQANPYPAGGGKNKLQNTATTQTVNGVTFTVNDDGTVRATGTATAHATLKFPINSGLVVGTSYIINGCPAGGSNSTYEIMILRQRDEGPTVNEYGSGATFDYDPESHGRIQLVVRSGQTVNITFKPMIRLASVTDATFAPYSNICPISGWDAVNVTRTGKNILKLPTWAEMMSAPTTGSYHNIKIKCKPSTKYYLSTTYTDGYTSVNKGWYLLIGESPTNTNWKSIAHSTQGAVDGAVTSTADGYLYLNCTSITENNYNDMVAHTQTMLEAGNTATAYEPYNGTTYPISLGQTVYGGVLDVTSGELTVTHTIMDLGDLNWVRITNYNNPLFWADLPSDAKGYTTATESDNGSDICSIFGRLRDTSGYYNKLADGNYLLAAFGLSFVNRIYARYDACESASDFKTAVTGQKLVYELATPTTIQLTPTEVTTLLGDNNIWADCGDVAVLYRADTKAYIDGTIVDVPLAMIAPIETGTTSSKAYAVGEYFILNGTQFCKAKTAIASGATFTLNTNYTVTTIANELKALQ